MKDDKNYYLTTAIAYASAKPHIGNIYEIVLTDAIARFKREQGYHVYFQTGTDEHGQKIQDNAKANHKEPRQYVDEVSGVIQGLFDLMNVDYDRFMRTTDPYHVKQVQKIFKRFLEQDDIYLGTYSGWYCKADEAFYSEMQIETEGICPDCGGPLEHKEEACYFFKLSKYQDQLVKHIEENPLFIQPDSRKNEMLKNFLSEPLHDLSITRTSFDWGIPVDFAPEHVVYVWLDALVNYITGIGYDADGNHDQKYLDFWPADVHVIGKDILRFHTIYWPIFLMALDIEMPKQIFGHPWLLVGEDKMSKSKGNAVYVDDLTPVLGVDAVRYIMLHEMPYERDGHITKELMIERINTDLANIMGNLVNRTVSMANKYFGGTFTTRDAAEAIDQPLIEQASQLIDTLEKQMETLHVSDAISSIVSLFRAANKYLDDTAPWALVKDEKDADRLQTILYNVLETARIGGIALRSFIPETSERLLKQLNTPHTSFEVARTFGLLELNKPVTDTPEIIFARLDKEETLAALEPEVIEAEPEMAKVSFDEFKAVSMKTGKIIEVKKHPKADRLFVLQVDLGTRTVQIVSGLVGHYTEETLLNHEVVVVENLEPVTLRGELSQGMVLAAEDDQGLKLVIVPGIAPGTIIS